MGWLRWARPLLHQPRRHRPDARWALPALLARQLLQPVLPLWLPFCARPCPARGGLPQPSA
eukprot:13642619-Alexandrium_andersonii.AAC.1